jgi:glycine/D-amino acid oxidase-like deaminating enzyme
MVYDALIVGAGVTGVAIARALSLKNPSWQITVVEKEAAVAYHTSGRNSGEDTHFAEKSRRVDKFKDRGKTILLATYDLTIIKSWCHQVLRLDKGKEEK